MSLTENFFDKKHPENTKIGQNTQLDMENQKKEEKKNSDHFSIFLNTKTGGSY